MLKLFTENEEAKFLTKTERNGYWTLMTAVELSFGLKPIKPPDKTSLELHHVLDHIQPHLIIAKY